jgi:hypothetical protein
MKWGIGTVGAQGERRCDVVGAAATRLSVLRTYS